MNTSGKGDGSLKEGTWKVLGFVFAVKALLFALGIFSYEIYANKRIEWPMGFFQIWNQWDCPAYLTIAEVGYAHGKSPDTNLAFFPLYPMCIRVLMLCGIPALLGAFIVSTIASTVAAVLLYRLARKDEEEPVAWNALWFLLIFPTAYFLHIGMTESLFLALTLASFLFARKRQWVLAGAVGSLAALTRVVGLLLIPTLAVEAWLEYRETKKINLDWLWLLCISFGTLTYLWINYDAVGNPFYFLKLQHDHWSHKTDWPWRGIWNAFYSMSWHEPAHVHLTALQEGIFALLGLWATIMAAIRLRPSYAVWIGANWLLVTSRDFLISTPRYMLVLFPLFLLWGRLPPQGLWFRLVTVWSLFYLGVLTSMWVQGRWGF